MSKVILIVAMIAIAGFLLRLSIKGEKKRKYDRKPQTPWAKLNDDVDPSL
jgi:hypothetical protein